MRASLSLRTSQHLALTPQLQQSIRLLQLSTLELAQEVEQMLDDNPFLEREADEASDAASAVAPAEAAAAFDEDNATESIADYSVSTGVSDPNTAEAPMDVEAAEPDWEGDGSLPVSPDDSEWGGEARARGPGAVEDDEADATDRASAQPSLQDHLHTQALALRLGEVDRAALRFLIESLNDDGYLEDALPALAQGLAGADAGQAEELVHHFTVALRLLQSLEPTGVGARDLAECLRLQLLERLAQPGQAPARQAVLRLALALCEQPLELLARRDVRRLMTLCKAGDAEVREAIGLIASLEPRPGRRFADVSGHAVVPDVLVQPVGRGAQARWRVQLNGDVMPRLRVHEVYAAALRQQRGGREAAGHAALQQRLQEARWFIKNIQQRFDTILRVSGAIVEHQKGFFQHGELAMRPLVLREIADELGLHESTISRVTTAKYMATPFGTYELKYFFGSGLGTDSGASASSTAVRALIRQFVAAESPKKPLSDNQIAAMLKEQGIDCARRTVAKYREGLRIAPASLRKAL